MEFDAVSPPVVAHTSARLEAERLASSWLLLRLLIGSIMIFGSIL